MSIKDLGLRESLVKELLKFSRQAVTVALKKELYRILLIAEKYGWEWNYRDMYGGGTEISIFDGLDKVAQVTLPSTHGEASVRVSYMGDYLKYDFEPLELAPYNPELDAELRNEEALYGYELPRPWIHAWAVEKPREWISA